MKPYSFYGLALLSTCEFMPISILKLLNAWKASCTWGIILLKTHFYCSDCGLCTGCPPSCCSCGGPCHCSGCCVSVILLWVYWWIAIFCRHSAPTFHQFLHWYKCKLTLWLLFGRCVRKARQRVKVVPVSQTVQAEAGTKWDDPP